jgi:hypothetical protein
VECRVWPETAERPEAPFYRIRDERYRSGAAAFSVYGDEAVFLRWAEVTVACPEPEPARFRRADSNADGKVDISDGVHVLGHLFLGGAAPGCPDAADANDSGAIDLSDASFIFNYLFLGAEAPPAPGASDCGADASDDGLGACEAYPACL